MLMKGVLKLFGLLYPLTFSYADMYKWVDERGNVNYGDHCPVAECEPQSIKISPRPTDEQIHQSQERMKNLIERTQRLEQSRKQTSARKQRQKEAKQKAKVKTMRECARARQNLHVLKKPRPAYTIDHKGEYLFYDDDMRAKEIERLQGFISKNCE
ncbi:MAG: DUF4124 domain-containing protein [Gammaproteobacteria bacterium]|nr:DUF4124 domain-containing protein [Gammaproteobacteria bacterium]